MPRNYYYGSRPPTAEDGDIGDYYLDISQLRDLRLILYGPKHVSGTGVRQAISLMVDGDAPFDAGNTVEVSFVSALASEEFEIELGGESGPTTPAELAAAIRQLLWDHEEIGFHFEIAGEGNEVIVIAHIPAPNDDTLAMTIDPGDSEVEESSSTTVQGGVFEQTGFPEGQAQVERVIVAGTVAESGTIVAAVTSALLAEPFEETIPVSTEAADQVVTTTVVGTIAADGAGDVRMGWSETPGEHSYSTGAAVANNDTAAQVATKLVAALVLDGVDAEADGADVIIRRPARADGQNMTVYIAPTDPELVIGFIGPTTAVGIAPAVSVVTEEGNVVDTLATVAARIRAALAAEEDIAGNFNVSGSGAQIILTATAEPPAANDPTFNIAITDVGETGITAVPTSTTLQEGHVIEPDPAAMWPELRRYCHAQILIGREEPPGGLSEFGTKLDSFDYIFWDREAEVQPAIFGPRGFEGWPQDGYVNIDD